MGCTVGWIRNYPLFPQPRLPAFGVSSGAHAGEAESEAGGRRCQRKMRHRLLRCARGVRRRRRAPAGGEGAKEGAPERGGEEEKRRERTREVSPKRKGERKGKEVRKVVGEGHPSRVQRVHLHRDPRRESVGDP